MTEQTRNWRRIGVGVAIVALVAAGACSPKRSAKAPVDYRGSAPGAGTTAVVPPASTGTGSVVVEGGTRYLVAQEGDTVAAVAARHGVSASELAGYNGLTPDSRLHAGQELVVPGGSAGGDEGYQSP